MEAFEDFSLFLSLSLSLFLSFTLFSLFSLFSLSLSLSLCVCVFLAMLCLIALEAFQKPGRFFCFFFCIFGLSLSALRRGKKKARVSLYCPLSVMIGDGRKTPKADKNSKKPETETPTEADGVYICECEYV